MKRSVLVAIGVLVLSLSSSVSWGQGLSERDKAIVDAMAQGAPHGAIIQGEGFCSILTGFFDGDVLKAFGGLFQDFADPDACGNSFSRTNPDGTFDTHWYGNGAFFLVVMDGPFYSSEGSNVSWTIITHENGISTWRVNGTMSDGSRVRGHFTVDPKGDDNSKEGFLWVEGYGFVIGARGNK